ncbi:hypothetical protein BST81_12445 [Leptolyngbya sp. 'hensonii']|uniref:4a-hydroxytetrahydrobiopterin dehydratase n=1 Tax=Leptolyngbya sp. 'hensonii' TaxID=1922337 RepID=UPI0009500406|nr:4a-hydroxytetrahydrobiopterin dehydratase [Leptolyngbya sp. 'hensonii']OLP17864.1 hypothetical protein BST81_12445 [Leptolyngbya sp. 'hensonii']
MLPEPAAVQPVRCTIRPFLVALGILSPLIGVPLAPSPIASAQPAPIPTIGQLPNPAPKLKRLTLLEISRRMKDLPGWKTNGKQLYCTRQVKDFVEAINFVNRLVEPAEKAAHHPDIQITYNKVTLSLTTHDAGGLTDQDFELAKIFSQLAASAAVSGTGC